MAKVGSLRDRLREFNVCLVSGLFLLADAKGVLRNFLNFVDVASKYRASKHPAVFWKTLMSTWCQVPGVPKALLWGQGGYIERKIPWE